MTTENERLRALLAEARRWLYGGVPWIESESKEIDDVARRIDAALAEPVSDDFRRGAEAMREAAASACWALSDELASVPDTLGEQQTAWGAATRIRALPLPEDR